MIPFGHPQPYPPHPYFPPVLYGHPQPYHQYPLVPYDQDPNDGAMVPYTPQNAQILRNNLQNKVAPTTLSRIMDAFKVFGEVSKVLWKFKEPLALGIASMMTASYVQTAANATVAGVTNDRQIENVYNAIRSNPNLWTYRDKDGNYRWLLDKKNEPTYWKMMSNTMKSIVDKKVRTNTGAYEIDRLTQEDLDVIFGKNPDDPSISKGVVAVPTVEEVQYAVRQSQDEAARQYHQKQAERQKECRDNKLACAGRYAGEALTLPVKNLWKIARGVRLFG